MEHHQLPPQAPKIEIVTRTETKDNSLNNAPTLDTSAQESGLSSKYLDMMIARTSKLSDQDQSLKDIAAILQNHDKSNLDLSGLNNSQLLAHLMETKQRLYGSVVPVGNSGRTDIPTNITSEAKQFRQDSSVFDRQVLLNDHRNGGSALLGNFNTMSSAGHVLKAHPESVIGHLSKTEMRPSIDPGFNPEPVEVTSNDPRVSATDSNLLPFRGALSKEADFALAGNSLDNIRREAASQLSNPNLLTDQQILAIVENGGVEQTTLYNSRNFVTGQNLIRPEKVEINLLPFYTDQLDYTGANLTPDQIIVFNLKGGMLSLAQATQGPGSSGSFGVASIKQNIANLQSDPTRKSQQFEINHSARFQINPKQAEIIANNNPKLDNYVRKFFLNKLGLNIGLVEAYNRELITNSREAGEHNIDKFVLSIVVVRSRNRLEEVLNTTNPVPQTIFQSPK